MILLSVYFPFSFFYLPVFALKTTVMLIIVLFLCNIFERFSNEYFPNHITNCRIFSIAKKGVRHG